MKKIGLLSLAIVLALGALGAAYAPWTDQVEISQVVHTGFLQVGIRGEADIQGDPKEVAGVVVTEWNDRFVKPDDGHTYYEGVTVEITNLFPCVTVTETFWIGVQQGSIPVKLMITASSIWVDPADPNLFDYLDIQWAVTGTHNGGEELEPMSGEGLGFYGALQGLQLHGCDVVKLEIVKKLEQNDSAQGLSGGFAVTVTAIQYNEYPFG